MGGSLHTTLSSRCRVHYRQRLDWSPPLSLEPLCSCERAWTSREVLAVAMAGNASASSTSSKGLGQNLIAPCRFSWWVCQEQDSRGSAPERRSGSQAGLETRTASAVFSLPMAGFQGLKRDYQK